MDALAPAVNECRRVYGADHAKPLRLTCDVDRQLLPSNPGVCCHIDFARRIGFVFGRDDGSGLRRSPIDRAEIPIAAQTGKASPGAPIGRPARRAVQRKAGHSRGRVLVHAGGPTGFVPAGNSVLVDSLPGFALVSATPQATADHLEGHVTVQPIDHHARTASRPGGFDATVGQALQQGAGNVRPRIGRLDGCRKQHEHDADETPHATL